MVQETADKYSWQSLATRINDEDSVELILANAGADYQVFLKQVTLWDELEESLVSLDKRFVTCRPNPNGLHWDYWEVVKDRYEVVQNEDIVRRAQTIVDRSQGLGTLYNCGVLDEGRKFFVAMYFGSTDLTVGETVDRIDNFLIVISSHDGSYPVCYYNLDVRRNNNAVYRFSSNLYDFDLRKRHTPNLTEHGVEAKEAINLRTNWTIALSEAIRSLQQPLSDSLFVKACNAVASLDKANTKSKREHAESVHAKIEELFKNSNNSGTFSKSRWALYNAIVEYIDFHRDIDIDDAVQHSLEIDNFSHRLKVEVFNLLK